MLCQHLGNNSPTLLARTTAAILARGDAIDPGDILAVGAVFGTLGGIERRCTPRHRRRLRLQLATFAHLAPLWDAHLPGDQRLCEDLAALDALIERPLSASALGSIEASVAAYPPAPPAIEQIAIGLDTTLKVFACIERGDGQPYGYAPDTHAGVALWCAARAYAAHAAHGQDEQPHEQAFLRRWLAEVAPSAWYPLPEDTE